MQLIYSLTLLSAVALLSGCSSFQKAPEARQSADIKSYLEKHQRWYSYNSESVDPAAAKPTKLPDLVAIPTLQTLVKRGLENNPAIKQTLLSLDIVRAQHKQLFGSELPEAALTMQAARGELAGTDYSASLAISWELDVWSKLNDQSVAAEQQVLASALDVQVAKDLLAANIMRTWLLASYQAQLILVEHKRLALQRSNEDLIKDRYRAGIGSLEDLDNARTNTSTTLATIESYQENLAQSKRLLVRLVSEHSAELFEEIDDEFPEVAIPLATIPAQDLAGRPDLKKQYRVIVSKELGVNVAYKDMLPSFNLQANLSDSSESLRDALFVSPVWSLLSQITAPLFQGGKLKAAKEIAELEAEQAYWSYQEILLTAINETENALSLERTLTLKGRHIDDALFSAQRSIINFENKYRQGLVEIVDLLQVQQQAFNLEVQKLQNTYEQLTNRVDLGLALGLGV